MSTLPPSMVYSATDLTLIIGACASAIIGMIASVRLSRCTHIKCGCIEIIKEESKNSAPKSLTQSDSDLDVGIQV